MADNAAGDNNDPDKKPVGGDDSGGTPDKSKDGQNDAGSNAKPAAKKDQKKASDPPKDDDNETPDDETPIFTQKQLNRILKEEKEKNKKKAATPESEIAEKLEAALKRIEQLEGTGKTALQSAVKADFSKLPESIRELCPWDIEDADNAENIKGWIEKKASKYVGKPPDTAPVPQKKVGNDPDPKPAGKTDDKAIQEAIKHSKELPLYKF